MAEKEAKAEKKEEENRIRAEKRAEAREQTEIDTNDSESDIEDVKIPDASSSKAPINNTTDLIVKDFLKNNTDLIKQRTDDIAKVDETIDETIGKLNKQKEVIKRIDDEKRKIQDKIDQLKKNK